MAPIYLNCNSTSIDRFSMNEVYDDRPSGSYSGSYSGGGTFPPQCPFNPSDIYYDSVKRFRNEMELIKGHILKYFGCSPTEYEVIFNSGASESINNVMFWCSKYLPGGAVFGSIKDHPNVEAAADNYDLTYTTENPLTSEHAPGMLFVTHVFPMTGEVYDLEQFRQLKESFTIGKLNDNDKWERTSLAYKPLYVLDACQSVTKIPINNKKYGFDAIFFSSHKIRGCPNNGVLIVRTSLIDGRESSRFRPLIAGKQNNMLRGGTLNADEIVKYPYLLTTRLPNIDKLKRTWKQFTTLLANRGIKFYNPSLPHLYTTILIEVPDVKEAIETLCDNDILVGSYTACSLEMNDKNNKYIRLSWDDSTPIDEKVMARVVDILTGIQ